MRLDLDHHSTAINPPAQISPHRVSHAPRQVRSVEPTSARAVQRTGFAAHAAATRRTPELRRHSPLHVHADRCCVAVVPNAVNDRRDPVVRSHDVYLRLGACERALAAAAFSDFVLFLFESTLPAAVAALDPVCRVFFFTAD
jgi:hypothetical protein